MSVARLRNEIRKEALLALGSAGRPRIGTITSYDPDNYAVKVTIQPEGFETGWLPLKSQWVGNGWGLFTGPSQGDQIEITFQEGAVEAGMAGAGLFSNIDRPLPVPSGEAWLVHQSGAFVKLTNDPALMLGDGAGATITLANGIATVLATRINLGAGATLPVMLSNSEPATKVFAV